MAKDNSEEKYVKHEQCCRFVKIYNNPAKNKIFHNWNDDNKFSDW